MKLKNPRSGHMHFSFWADKDASWYDKVITPVIMSVALSIVFIAEILEDIYYKLKGAFIR